MRNIAVPGALVQIAVATALGDATRDAVGMELGAAIVFGLALSVASTVVLLRALEDAGVLNSVNGRIAVGWLVVEDLVVVLVLVLLPALAGVLGGAAAGRAARRPRRCGRCSATPRRRWPRSWRSCSWWAGGSFPACSGWSRAPARASCSPWL